VTLLLEREEVERFRLFLSQRLGLQFDDGKHDDLAEYVGRRIQSRGLHGFDAYLAQLQDPARSGPELRALIEELTVGETYFFRNPNHFRALESALPALAQRHPLRLLSAGCASGEEPYSLAVLVREVLSEAQVSAARIVGIDVNPALLERARAGRYSSWSLRATPVEAQQRWFVEQDRLFVLHEALRTGVVFEERNLLADDAEFWRAQAYDVIFCRNVLIYFTAEAIATLIARFARALAPGGYLFLGDAENLRGLSHEFHLHHTHDTFYYQRRGSGEPAPVRATLPALQPALAPVLDPDASWMSAIHDASERIARLSERQRDAPRAVAAPPPQPVRWDLSAAMQLLQQERYAEAEQALEALPLEAATDPDARLLAAILLTNLGRLDEAERACARVLELDEMSASAH